MAWTVKITNATFFLAPLINVVALTFRLLQPVCDREDILRNLKLFSDMLLRCLFPNHTCKLTTFLVSGGGGSIECEDNMRNIFAGCMDTRLVDVTGSFDGEALLAIFEKQPSLLRPV